MRALGLAVAKAVIHSPHYTTVLDSDRSQVCMSLRSTSLATTHRRAPNFSPDRKAKYSSTLPYVCPKVAPTISTSMSTPPQYILAYWTNRKSTATSSASSPLTTPAASSAKAWEQRCLSVSTLRI